MHTNRRAILVIALTVMTLLDALTLQAAPPCPDNTMSLGGSPPFTSGTAQFDSTYAPEGYGGSFRTAYDLVAGTVRMYHCCSLGATSVEAGDLYDVVGVPPGTPVSLTVEFVVDGAVFTNGCGGTGCGGWYSLRLQHGTTTDERTNAIHLFSGREERHDVLSLPLTIVAGQPERIDFRLWGARSPGGSHGAEAFGRIQFTGLSQGQAVVSCQGFGGQVTPARTTTWGRLKAIYR